MKVPSGLTLIDDTFNANPASADVALSTLRDVPVSGRRVVVTPGLVEMGSQKRVSNERLALRAVELGFELVVVARTNARDLSRGAHGRVMRVDVREQAVEWVRAGLDGDDAVLYLNDLPDHYP